MTGKVFGTVEPAIRNGEEYVAETDEERRERIKNAIRDAMDDGPQVAFACADTTVAEQPRRNLEVDRLALRMWTQHGGMRGSLGVGPVLDYLDDLEAVAQAVCDAADAMHFGENSPSPEDFVPLAAAIEALRAVLAKREGEG